MSTYPSGYNDYPAQETLPNMEVINIIEGMSYEDRIKLKEDSLAKLSELESLVHTINDVNAGEGKE